jgi:hypothetical protein
MDILEKAENDERKKRRNAIRKISEWREQKRKIKIIKETIKELRK